MTIQIVLRKPYCASPSKPTPATRSSVSADELMPFITAGPQGTTGYAEGRPRVHPVFRYWPCLIERDAVTPKVEILRACETSEATPSITTSGGAVRTSPRTLYAIQTRSTAERSGNDRDRRPHLYDIAVARSGDKGSSATIGVIARSADWWEFLRAWLTSDRVAEYFHRWNRIRRSLRAAKSWALNFVLHGVLRQGLRTDAQGKALGQLLLELPLPEYAGRTITRNRKLRRINDA